MSYRVIQWATGTVGMHTLRSIVRHPDLELAGLVVHSEAKVGVDAGVLLGMEPLGVLAISDLESVVDLEADCVCHMPLPSAQVNDDPGLDERVICRLLESGKDVVTGVGFMYPRAHGGDLVDRLEQACKAGGSTLHGTGANPGFLSEVLPLTLSALCERIDGVHVSDFADFGSYPSPGLVFDVMGFGRPPGTEQATERWRDWVSGLFAESICMIGDGLGISFDRLGRHHEVALASDAFEISAGRIDVDTICAQRFRWTGEVDGDEVVTIEAVYKARAGVAEHWPESGAVRIEGRPTIELSLGSSWCSSEVRATAAHAVNAIPYVCRADPGIRTFLDLPMIVGRHAVTLHGAR